MTRVRMYPGRSSKYDDAIPFTYEARSRCIDGPEDYTGYFSDTVCGLIRILRILGYETKTVELYEIYRDREVKIASSLYARDGNWIGGSELCQSFRKIYPDHIGNNSCQFDDRNQIGER